jgi:murein DD-endopeptidase MepM/ murein hydrolase activator NlpD
MVKKGDEVSQGTTLFIIGDGNTELRYQISKEGIYIDPLEVIHIDG